MFYSSMLKRGVLAFVFLIVFGIFLLSGVFAQEEPPAGTDINETVDTGGDSVLDDTEEEIVEVEPEEPAVIDVAPDDATIEDEKEEDAGELEYGAGITPDSTFYFVEKYVLENFRDDLENREKKIAEIQEMIREGKVEDAREALQRYRNYADRLEKEVAPEDKERAERGARAIRRAIKDLKEDIPEDGKEDFYDEILDKEEKIEAAAQIAAKVKELCEQLSKLDPSQYERVCRTQDDAPRWQKDLDSRLTEEQKKEVREFIGIMSECFENPSECRCEDIKIKPFAEKCSVIAPLAAKCEQEGDENACEEMEKIEQEEDPFESLPDYLREAVENLENEYDEGRFEDHMPLECRSGGAKTAKECMQIMFEVHAPEECQQALKEGKISFTNEREAREACERIMFEENAPQECIDAGLKDHRACGKYMFEQNAPQECIDAGLTGEKPRDHRECERIMDSLRDKGEDFGGMRGPGPDCKRIEDSKERLNCYDHALEGVHGEFEGGFNDRGGFGGEGRGREGFEGNWPPQCVDAGATTPESCRKVMEEWGQNQRRDGEDQLREQREEEFRGDFRPPEGFQQPQCAPGQSWSCKDGQCHCEGQLMEQQPRQQEQPSTEQSPPQTSSPTTEQPSDFRSSGSGSSGGGDSEGSSGGENGGSGTTGSVIAIDNEFLEYYWK